MKGSPNIARVGALIGDSARASMLTALMSGKALTASELAREAGVTLQTASEEVANVLEGLMGLVAGKQPLRSRIGPSEVALRSARVCYNHLAGDRGIQLYDSLMTLGHLKYSNSALVLTASGEKFSSEFGIDMTLLRAGKAALCRECLDWSERRSHLAGSLGRAYLRRLEELKWVKRIEGTRVIKFSRQGEDSFNKVFGTRSIA